MQIPQEITAHIGGFMADELQAANPECYRSARTIQAVCRGWLARNTTSPWPCSGCGTVHPWPFWLPLGMCSVCAHRIYDEEDDELYASVCLLQN